MTSIKQAREFIEAREEIYKSITTENGGLCLKANSFDAKIANLLQYEHSLNGMGEVSAFAKGFLVAFQSEEVKELIKALEYCAVEREFLQPENNRQWAVAMNALFKFKQAVEEKEPE